MYDNATAKFALFCNLWQHDVEFRAYVVGTSLANFANLVIREFCEKRFGLYFLHLLRHRTRFAEFAELNAAHYTLTLLEFVQLVTLEPPAR